MSDVVSQARSHDVGETRMSQRHPVMSSIRLALQAGSPHVANRSGGDEAFGSPVPSLDVHERTSGRELFPQAKKPQGFQMLPEGLLKRDPTCFFPSLTYANGE